MTKDTNSGSGGGKLLLLKQSVGELVAIYE